MAPFSSATRSGIALGNARGTTRDGPSRDRFKLRSGNTGGYGSIVIFDNRGQIDFDGIADFYFCSAGAL